MIKRALLMVGIVMLSACGSDQEADADQVGLILRATAHNARWADKYYNDNLEIFNSVQMGKPIYQAHEEMKEPVNMLQLYVAGMADTRKNDVPKIINPAVRKSLDDGLSQMIDVYTVKLSFAADSRAVLADASILQEMNAKYEGKMDMLAVQAAQALVHFMDAKQKAGLPKELTEFQ